MCWSKITHEIMDICHYGLPWRELSNACHHFTLGPQYIVKSCGNNFALTVSAPPGPSNVWIAETNLKSKSSNNTLLSFFLLHNSCYMILSAFQTGELDVCWCLIVIVINIFDIRFVCLLGRMLEPPMKALYLCSSVHCCPTSTCRWDVTHVQAHSYHPFEIIRQEKLSM